MIRFMESLSSSSGLPSDAESSRWCGEGLLPSSTVTAEAAIVMPPGMRDVCVVAWWVELTPPRTTPPTGPPTAPPVPPVGVGVPPFGKLLDRMAWTFRDLT